MLVLFPLEKTPKLVLELGSNHLVVRDTDACDNRW